MGVLAALTFKDLTTMTIEEKTKAYKIKVNKLIKEIEEILNSHLSKSKQSDKITARLREEYIFAKNSYIKKFNNASLVTIDPYSEDVKPELEEGDIEGTEDDEYSRIPAYSFGPFNCPVYFDDDIFKIFWLIKEPFCENPDELVEAYYKNDSDYYNQAKSYSTWDSLEYKTHINIVKISQIILTQLAHIELDNILDERVKNSLSELREEDLDDMNQVMKHICIIEVNHFPGLAFNSKISKNSLIGDWAEINNDLIQELIAFYNPNVIIGGNTLGHFYPDGYKLIGEGNTHSFDHIKEGIKNGNEMFKILGLTILKDETNYMQVRKDYLFKTKEGIILVDSSHPSRYSKVQSEENGKQIKHWYESETQIKVTKFWRR